MRRRVGAGRHGLSVVVDAGDTSPTAPRSAAPLDVLSDRPSCDDAGKGAGIGPTAPARPDRSEHPSLSSPRPVLVKPASATEPGQGGDSPASPAPTLDPAAGAPRTPGVGPNVAVADRLTPYQSGLAAVSRRDVHIQRVWPMRSPSTGTLEASSSANFQRVRRGSPPAGVLPVGGLRMIQAYSHEPVMADEVVDLFRTVPPGLIVDSTLGGGGHAHALLGALPQLSLLGIDRDPAAVAAATGTLQSFGSRVVVRRSRFDAFARVVREVQDSMGVPSTPRCLSGALFDLGVSSPQLDVAERGFSYRRDAPLDMRMDPSAGRTAAIVLNESTEDELTQLFIDNGEGRFARRIAKAVVAARPLITTGQLADVVRTAIPAATRRTGGHPARRVFQAVRIAVNEELDQLTRALDDALELLVPGGRCVVISYHSGEDRLVKQVFTRAVTGGCVCPPGLPCVCGAEARFEIRRTRGEAPERGRDRSEPPGRSGQAQGRRTGARRRRRCCVDR